MLLLEEDWDTPSLAFGINDVQGTGLFRSSYLAASKQFGALDAMLGVGTGRISGAFAGARYAPAEWNGVALVAEYDANNYKQDKGSTQTGVDQRKKGIGLDALKQRDVGGGLGFRNYSTVTALAAVHYRLPTSGVTATARAGRFLAGDLGTRLEMKRRFRSGFTVGAWYSLTNGNDITRPRGCTAWLPSPIWRVWRTGSILFRIPWAGRCWVMR